MSLSAVLTHNVAMQHTHPPQTLYYSPAISHSICLPVTYGPDGLAVERPPPFTAFPLPWTHGCPLLVSGSIIYV